MDTPQPPDGSSDAARSREELAKAIGGAYGEWCKYLAPMIQRERRSPAFLNLAVGVDELAAEVTRRALERPLAFDPHKPPFAWLNGIAHNVLREWRRQQGAEAQLHVNVARKKEEEAAMLDDEADAETAAEQTRRAERAMGKLDPDDRRLVQMRISQGLTCPAIAKLLGAPSAAAIRTRVCRAVAALRAHFFADREEGTS